jgi:predicted ATP-grasp superfamily ATP-dependent carboligase
MAKKQTGGMPTIEGMYVPEQGMYVPEKKAKKSEEQGMYVPEKKATESEEFNLYKTVKKASGAGGMKAGGKVSSASKRADGCAIRGKTKA